MSIPTEVTNASVGASDSLVKSPPTDAIDVRDYGAQLDGSHDDSTAIQDALDAASPGDTVYIPAGTAHIATRIILDAQHSGVTLQGAGSSTHLRLKSGISRNYQLLRMNPDSAVTDLTIRDLRLDGQGNKQNEKNIWGIQMRASGAGDNNNLVENVWVHDFTGANIQLQSPGTTLRFASAWGAKNWHGIKVECDINNSNRPIIVEYCYVRENNVHGIDASGGHSVIRHLLSEENGWGGKNTLNTLSSEWTDVVFRNNDQIGWMMPTDNCGDVTMRNVMAIGNGNPGFYFNGSGSLSGSNIVALDNCADKKAGNIWFPGNWEINVDSIATGSAVNGHGLNIGADASGQIQSVVVDGENDSGGIDNDSSVTIESTSQQQISPIEIPTNPDASSDDLPHILEVDGSNVTDLTEYSITVTDGIEHDTDAGTLNDSDTIEGTTASGVVLGGLDAYNFAGEITDATFTGDVQNLVVRVDGSAIDLNTLVGPANVLEIAPSDTTENQQDPIEFVVKASGPIASETSESLTFYEDDTVAVGFSYWWPTTLEFDGDLVEAHIPSGASVVLNGNQLSASEL